MTKERMTQNKLKAMWYVLIGRGVIFRMKVNMPFAARWPRGGPEDAFVTECEIYGDPRSMPGLTVDGVNFATCERCGKPVPMDTGSLVGSLTRAEMEHICDD